MTAEAPDRAALVALAERCEKAEGPDRELDAEIVVAVTPECAGIERPPLEGLPECAGWLMRYDPPRRWSESWLPVPAYTASLDAALTLVPEGWQWDTGNFPHPNAVCYPQDGGQTTSSGDDDESPRPRTPALALSAAALRALASEAGQ